MTRDYRVILIHSEEGFSASCPALRGCHSQGSTLDEALAWISTANQWAKLVRSL